MMYLFVPEDGDPWQSDVAPTPEQAEDVIHGLLKVFRFEGARATIYEPIQTDDPDSWGDVPFERK